mgnify:CR=1 FL=1
MARVLIADDEESIRLVLLDRAHAGRRRRAHRDDRPARRSPS